MVAKVLFANNKSEKSKKDKSEQTGGSYTSSVDDELDKMKKNMSQVIHILFQITLTIIYVLYIMTYR